MTPTPETEPNLIRAPLTLEEAVQRLPPGACLHEPDMEGVCRKCGVRVG